jgi:hypothetical protein
MRVRVLQRLLVAETDLCYIAERDVDVPLPPKEGERLCPAALDAPVEKCLWSEDEGIYFAWLPNQRIEKEYVDRTARKYRESGWLIDTLGPQ